MCKLCAYKHDREEAPAQHEPLPLDSYGGRYYTVYYSKQQASVIDYLTTEWRDGVTIKEAQQVIDHGREFEMVPSRRGNDRLMFVGWSDAARLLEIGVEILSESKFIVFHAMAATTDYRKKFEE